MLNIEQIKEIIPHRYPFLLVDKILEVDEGKRAVGIKNVSANEEFFNGHFPDYAVMPGVLIVEALAQVGAVAVLKKEENRIFRVRKIIKKCPSIHFVDKGIFFFQTQKFFYLPNASFSLLNVFKRFIIFSP